IEVETYTDTAKECQYLITKTMLDANGDSKQQFMLLNSSYKIISGTIPTMKTQYTKREFDFLTYNFYNKNSLYKHNFISSNGENFTAVYLDSIGIYNNASDIILGVSIGASILLYALLLTLFIIYTNKKVKLPLKALDCAMQNYAALDSTGKLEYKGAREFEDITASFNTMVEKLSASEQQKRALEDDKRRMLAGLSHDLKTPITVIKGFATALSDGIVKEEDQQKYLDIITSKSNNMIELIDSFYEYAKLEHPEFKLELERVDISELFRRYFATKYDEITLNGFNLEVEIPDKEIFCNLDIKNCKRVIENLIGNCLKYNPSGTTLLIAIDALDKTAKVTVADNGVGIPEKVRSSIFQAFQVGDEARGAHGSGLGLTVCKRIVDAHGGEITLADTPKDGYATQFEIEIPLAE
ncbi:MAG: HAMP domain-containing sensor histidine kinase, partial [Clostridia bacterium]